MPGNESRIVRHGTAQQTVVLEKNTKFKHGTKLERTLCYVYLPISQSFDLGQLNPGLTTG